MHRRWIRAAGVTVACLSTVACGAPYVVVHEASPNPFLGQREFAVLPVDYSELRFQGPVDTQRLAADEASVNDAFQSSLRNVADDAGIDVLDPPEASGAFVLRPSVHVMVPGVPTASGDGPSRIELSMAITDPRGFVLDQIVFSHWTDAQVHDGGDARLRADADALGEAVALYLRDRTGDYDDERGPRKHHRTK